MAIPGSVARELLIMVTLNSTGLSRPCIMRRNAKYNLKTYHGLLFSLGVRPKMIDEGPAPKTDDEGTITGRVLCRRHYGCRGK
ncbi:unnamed protein product, partial [Iphiclides podalirius]